MRSAMVYSPVACVLVISGLLARSELGLLPLELHGSSPVLRGDWTQTRRGVHALWLVTSAMPTRRI